MSLPNIAIDKYIKFGYGSVNNKYRFHKNWVGPQTHIDIESAPADFDTDDYILVDTVAGYDTSTGSLGHPKLTYTASANACTATKTKVLQINSELLHSEDLSAIDNAYFEGIYTSTGATSTYTLLTLGYTPSDANTIYVKKTGLDANAGTYAAPKLTVDAADDIASGKKVIILDSETYTVAARTMVADSWCAALGETPTLQWTQTSASVVTTSAEHSFANLDCSTTYRDLASCILTNGNIAFAYVKDSDHKGYVVVCDISGSILYGPTNFGAATSSYIDLYPLADSMFLLCYNAGAVTDGLYQVWNSNASYTGTGGTIDSTTSNYLSCAVLPVTDNRVFAWKNGADNKGKFRIYNSSWGDIKTETEFEAGETNDIRIVPLSTGSFFIVYVDVTDGNKGKYVIVNSTGTEITSPIPFSDNAIVHISAAKMSDNKFVITYSDSTDSNKGKFIILNSDGTVYTATTTFSDTTTYVPSVNIFSDDKFLISFYDYTGDDNGVFLFYSSEGIRLIERTVFKNTLTTNVICDIFTDDSFFITFIDDNDTDKGKFLYYTSVNWVPLTVSSSATFSGIILDGENQDYLYRMIDGSAKITAVNSEFINATSTLYSNAWAVYSSAEVDLQKCKIHDNAQGVFTQENTSTILDNEFYWNSEGYALHIKGTAASLGDIDVQHNTFFDNYAGLQLEDNGGTNEVVKNNILHKHITYAISAETAMTTTYSVITGNVNNCSLGTGCTTTNPLFLDEGENDPNNLDLRTMMLIVGDYATSPAYQLADDSSPDRDAGCWDTIPIGEAPTWSYLVLPKPINPAPTLNFEMNNAIETKKKSGARKHRIDSITEVRGIKWDGMYGANLETLLEMLASGITGNDLLQVYWNPITYPSIFSLYNLKYGTVKASTKTLGNYAVGAQDVEIEFSKIYE